MTRSPRPRANLSDSVHQQLNMYALAAAAAGVGALSTVHDAEAKVVYTPTHVNVLQEYCFDLDHKTTGSVNALYEKGNVCLLRHAHYYNSYVSAVVSQGGVAVSQSGTQRANELALPRGARIGPARHFTNASFDIMADGDSSKGTFNVQWFGPWANGGKGVRNRYLGIKFIGRDGHFHYGWARLTLTIDNPKVNHISDVLLTGYAYETIPGKAITAGQTKGTEDSTFEPDAALTNPVSEPPTLGALALGAPGLSIWRKDTSLDASSFSAQQSTGF